MVIDFDRDKDTRNCLKHGVSLALADGFDWPTVLMYPARIVCDEVRHTVIGEIDGIVYTAIVTWRRGIVRIISLRYASRKERTHYAATLRHP